MKYYILFFNFFIPILMIGIGFILKIGSHKKERKILSVFIPFIMFFAGINKEDDDIFLDKGFSFIWIVSGILLLSFIMVLLIIYRKNIWIIIYSIFELECLIFCIDFVISNYFYKKKKSKGI